ncbi:MAG TPA: CBS domain-containing protein [Saprospiraceae bacterium]|nr:CBS domain-containing protein [Saprospiraceae bacterium]HRO08603.1 CBS domain-containing protein [Saprospiraceae bacterium]HRO72658.1 CBS domain-containing protein [Saprospiraceae bacterium]HRP41989.1 CBS domain-containing protein [Saprospiraceae bacterium]
MMNQEVRAIMSKDPIVATPTQTIKDVEVLMLDNSLQQLPVTFEGKLVGMVTVFDLWRANREGKSDNTLVSDVMSTKIIKITPKDKVGTAAELFADQRFKTLPVVNLDNELKGVVTAFDVIRISFNEEYPRPILFEEAFR